MLEGLSTRYPEKTSYLGQVFNDTSNSYKFVWFVGILSLLPQHHNGPLPLADLMTEMAVTAWHPVWLFRLSLGRQDKLQEAILRICEHSGLPPDAKPGAIRRFVTGSAEARERLDFFRRYVPTPFLTPWCADRLRGLADSERDEAIRRLARDSQSGPLPTPYWFDGEHIRFNASWRHFLIENLGVVRAFAEYHPDGYNIGINVGAAAGQTVMHAHIHVIPRYTDDVPDPRGGVRRVIPGEGRYW